MPFFLILCSAGFLSTVVMRMADPIVPILSAEFGVPAADLAILVTAYAAPYALFQLIFGPLGDLHGKIRVIRWSALALALFIALTALAPDFGWMIVARALAGVAGGAIIPLGIATLGDRTPMATRQVVLSRFMMAVLIGQITGAFLTGLVAEVLPWRGIMAAYALLGAGITALLFTLPDDAPTATGERTARAVLSRYVAMFRRPKARLVLGLVLTEGMLVYGLVAFLPPYLAEIRHMSSGRIGTIMGMFGIGGLAFSATVAMFLRWLGPYRMLVTGGLIGAVVAFAVLRDLPFALYLACGFGLGFCFLIMHSNLQVRATEIDPEARGSSLAVFACGLFLGNGIGPAIFTQLLPVMGYGGVFAAIGVALATFGVVASVLLQRSERG